MTPSKEQFLAALAKTEQLFPAPRTLGRALFLLRDVQSDLGDISGLIGCDPALAADILRCANSAFYGFGTRVSAVDEAVQKIGFRETIRLLSLVVAHGTASRDLGSYGIAAEDFWAESLFSGLFLENLARTCSELESDEAYTAGLLRFLGRLAINQTLEDFGGGLFWNGTDPLDAWELETVGLTQATAGALLLRKWKFSEAMALAVESQDAPDITQSSNSLVQAMHFLARLLPAGRDLACFLSLDQQPLVVPEDHPFARLNGLDTERVAALIGETHKSFLAIRTELYR
jgi:HD-like signal output (HDOD) protein